MPIGNKLVDPQRPRRPSKLLQTYVIQDLTRLDKLAVMPPLACRKDGNNYTIWLPWPPPPDSYQTGPFYPRILHSQNPYASDEIEFGPHRTTESPAAIVYGGLIKSLPAPEIFTVNPAASGSYFIGLKVVVSGSTITHTYCIYTAAELTVQLKLYTIVLLAVVYVQKVLDPVGTFVNRVELLWGEQGWPGGLSGGSACVLLRITGLHSDSPASGIRMYMGNIYGNGTAAPSTQTGVTVRIPEVAADVVAPSYGVWADLAPTCGVGTVATWVGATATHTDDVVYEVPTELLR